MDHTTDGPRMAILERLERGEITASEAMALLDAPPEISVPAGVLDERDELLDRIDRGEITAGEALRRLGVDDWDDAAGATGAQDALSAVAGATPGIAPDAGTFAAEELAGMRASHHEPPPPLPEIESWRRWYQIPLAAGIAAIVLGTLLMYSALQASGIGFWFLCAGAPVMLGILLAVLAWLSRKGPWLHVRVSNMQGTWPRTLAISFPLPARATARALRAFAPQHLPLRGMSMDDLVEGLSSASPDAPFYVDVVEGKNGERVQVFIG